jgi:putative redox protein
MQCKVNWLGDGKGYEAVTQSGHSLLMDISPELGGNNLGPRPMELMLCAAGGCSSIDVIMILRKGRHEVMDCHVEVEATRAETDPKVFTALNLHFHIRGKVTDEAAARAIELSKKKYCSAIAMLAKTANVTSSFVVEAA